MKTMLQKTVFLLMIILLFTPSCTLPASAPTPSGGLTFTPTLVEGIPHTPTLLGGITETPTLVGDITATPTLIGGITDTPTLVGDVTETPTWVGDLTLTPTLVDGITLTPTLVQPNVTALKNANCRYGPGTAYEIADTLFAGKSAPLVGRNEQNTWWQIKGPTFGSLCWVSGVTVDIHGSLDGIPIETVPPPPTMTPEPRHKPQSQGCYVYDASGKPVCTAPCPANAKPGGVCKP